MKHKTGLLLFLLFLVATHAQNTDSLNNATFKQALPYYADELLELANEAIAAENWDLAIHALQTGADRFTNDSRFVFRLGELFSSRKLYDLAYGYLLQARKKGETNPALLPLLSETAGYLNQDEQALQFLSEYLDLNPDSAYDWATYGWLCYKTHRLDQGISAIHAAIEKIGRDSSLLAILGTLYTGAYRYDLARQYYSMAIEEAEERGQPYLKSIFLYNRSILEETFYRFEQAYDDAQLSLAASEHTSGHLMLGELETRRMDLAAALAQYRAGSLRDQSPLSSIGLANTYLSAGYPHEALKHVAAIRTETNLSWIANFGTSPDNFDRDLHAVSAGAHRFLAAYSRTQVVHNFSTAFSRLRNRVIHRIQFWYHDSVARIRNKAIGTYYRRNARLYNTQHAQQLHINSYFFQSFTDWRRPARYYLNLLEQQETTLIPEAQPSYISLQGILTGNRTLLDKAIVQLDPEWERNYLEKTLARRIQRTPQHQKQLKRDLAIRLYEINPAALVHHDLRLPVHIRLSDTLDAVALRTAKNLGSELGRSRFKQDTASPLEIVIAQNEKNLEVSLQSRKTGQVLSTFYTHSLVLNPAERAAFINTLSTSCFRYRLLAE